MAISRKENLGINNCDGNWYSVALHIIILWNYDREGNSNIKKQ